MNSFNSIDNKDLENNFNEMIKEIKSIIQILECSQYSNFGIYNKKIKNYVEASMTSLDFYVINFNNSGRIINFIFDFERNHRKRYKIVKNFLILFDNWGTKIKYIVPLDYDVMLECDF